MLFFPKRSVGNWWDAFNTLSGEPPVLVLDYIGVAGGQFMADAVEKTFDEIHTFERSSTALARASSGFYATISSGDERLDHDVDGNRLGLWMEGSRVNICIHSDDWTNAAYDTVTNMTTAKDQTGADNSANSASSLLADAANAIITQAITSASAGRVFSVHIKRITGTGNIELTQDGGTTWLDISGIINSSTYTQVVTARATVTNPAVGVRIVASGDKVAVQYGQSEITNSNGSFSSPIPTTTVAVTRALENTRVSVSDFAWGGNIGAEAAEGGGDLNVREESAAALVGTSTGTATGMGRLSSNDLKGQMDIGNGTVQSNNAPSGAWTTTGLKLATSWNATDVKISCAGSTIASLGGLTAIMDSISEIRIGWRSGGGGRRFNSHMRYVSVYAPSTILSDADVVGLAT